MIGRKNRLNHWRVARSKSRGPFYRGNPSGQQIDQVGDGALY